MKRNRVRNGRTDASTQEPRRVRANQGMTASSPTTAMNGRLDQKR